MGSWVLAEGSCFSIHCEKHYRSVLRMLTLVDIEGWLKFVCEIAECVPEIVIHEIETRLTCLAGREAPRGDIFHG